MGNYFEEVLFSITVCPYTLRYYPDMFGLNIDTKYPNNVVKILHKINPCIIL